MISIITDVQRSEYQHLYLTGKDGDILAEIYQWHSNRKAEDVLETLLTQTDPWTSAHPLRCLHKQLSKEEIEFSLYSGRNNREGVVITLPASWSLYSLPTLKGTIRDSHNGCVVTAEVHYFESTSVNVITLGGITLLGILSVIMIGGMLSAASPFFDIHANFSQGILATISFIVLSLYYIYSYKKFGKLKAHMAIMKAATGADCRIRYT
jgi:hypothetical protein